METGPRDQASAGRRACTYKGWQLRIKKTMGADIDGVHGVYQMHKPTSRAAAQFSVRELDKTARVRWKTSESD
jgi:hypothetical protein